MASTVEFSGRLVCAGGRPPVRPDRRNPPYIAEHDRISAGRPALRAARALTDGSRDGLDSIRAIVDGARAHLNAAARPH
jgi:hypothetical protein